MPDAGSDNFRVADYPDFPPCGTRKSLSSNNIDNLEQFVLY